jgi:hypothetical protein
MLNRTLKEALRNHAAEFDRLASTKPGYRNNGALNDYLAAIDEFEEAVDRGDDLEEAFNGTFASSGALHKFLLPAFKKYAEPSKAKLPPKDFVAYLASIGESNEIN